MNALLLIKELTEMILEDPTADIQVVFEDADGNLLSTTWELDWTNWNDEKKTHDCIVVRI